MNIYGSFPALRMRRMRRDEFSRRLMRETTLMAGDLIYPVFVLDGKARTEKVASMPGVERMTVDRLLRLAEQCVKFGIPVLALFVPLMGAAIGFYDGIFGPGTGSFLTMGFVALFGLGITRAAGNTKILNLASNLGALALFIPSGDVVWAAAGAMAVGQLIGGYLGALTGIRFGAKLIKPLVVAISLALAVKLLFFR